MAYNYQQYYPQNNSIIWVQGEAGAKSYLVAPNTTVQLWDSESQTIYLKSADASGMPSIKVLDYTVRPVEQRTAPVVYSDDLKNLQRQIDDLRAEFKNFTEGGHE